MIELNSHGLIPFALVRIGLGKTICQQPFMQDLLRIGRSEMRDESLPRPGERQSKTRQNAEWGKRPQKETKETKKIGNSSNGECEMRKPERESGQPKLINSEKGRGGAWNRTVAECRLGIGGSRAMGLFHGSHDILGHGRSTDGICAQM